MMTLAAVFWMFVIYFGLIGGFRGWAKELLVTCSMLVGLTIIILLEQQVPPVRAALDGQSPMTAFVWRSALFLFMVGFGYASPTLTLFSAKAKREKITEVALGLVLGMLNGYFLMGTVWYYMDLAGYPIPQVTPPTDPRVVGYLAYLPPKLIGVPTIYFLVVLAFAFVIIVFV